MKIYIYSNHILTINCTGIDLEYHKRKITSIALEDALGITPDYNGKIARDISNGFEFLQNHLRQIYLFSLPDYIEAPEINPLYTNDNKHNKQYRLSEKETNLYRENYICALEISRLAHKVIGLLSGKAHIIMKYL